MRIADRRGDELPEELQRRETRMARIREAKHALEERAREQAKGKGKDPEESNRTTTLSTLLLRIARP